MNEMIQEKFVEVTNFVPQKYGEFRGSRFYKALSDERGDVPGWVLVVLMTTGLVTAIWTIAAPRLSTILRNSLDSMNGIR
jgi:hypothetical protein